MTLKCEMFALLEVMHKNDPQKYGFSHCLTRPPQAPQTHDVGQNVSLNQLSRLWMNY